MKERNKLILQKVIFGLIALASAVLAVTLLSYTHPALHWSLFGAGIALTAALVIISGIKHPIIYKLLIIASVILLIYVISHIALHYSGLSERLNSVDAVREVILSTGNWGLVIFFLLTLLQVVVLPIPAAVTVVAGAAIYGAVVSFIISTIGTIVGSVICFFLGRIFGKKLIVWLIGKEKTDKYSTLIAKKGKGLFVGMMLFPFFPDDILCMTAGLTKMTFRFFIVAITLTRPVMLAFYSFFGADDVLGYDFAGIMLRIAILAGFLLFMLVFQIVYKKVLTHLEKRKKKKPSKSTHLKKAAAAETAEDMTVEKKPRKKKTPAKQKSK